MTHNGELHLTEGKNKSSTISEQFLTPKYTIKAQALTYAKNTLNSIKIRILSVPCHWILKWVITIYVSVRRPLTYIKSYSPGESTGTNTHQWELEITRTFSRRK